MLRTIRTILGIITVTSGIQSGCAESENPGKGSKRPATITTEDNNKDDPAPAELQSFEQRCGWSELASEKTVLDEAVIEGIDKHFTGSQGYIILNVPYKITVQPRLKLKTTLSEVTIATEIDVSADPSDARGPAEKQISWHRGSLTAKLLAPSERDKALRGSADWNEITCAVVSATELTTIRGSAETVVKFSPALPLLTMARADAATFAAELGSERIFRGIEAEVVRGGSLTPGLKISGAVSISRINPNLVLQQTTGKSATIKANSAWKIKYEFGSSEQTKSLGLHTEQLFYIDHGQRKFKAVVLDAGDSKTGAFVFADDAQVIND